MSQAERFTTYLEYKTLKDLLKVILFTSQSFMSITPLLYYTYYQNKHILFIHTGIIGGIVAHYHIIAEKPKMKFIELNQLTGEFDFAENIGSNGHSINVHIVSLNPIFKRMKRSKFYSSWDQISLQRLCKVMNK